MDHQKLFDEHFGVKSPITGKFMKRERICVCSKKLEKVHIKIGKNCQYKSRYDDSLCSVSKTERNERHIHKNFGNKERKIKGFGYTIKDKFLATSDVLRCDCERYYLECRLCNDIIYAYSIYQRNSMETTYNNHIYDKHRKLLSRDLTFRLRDVDFAKIGVMKFTREEFDSEFINNQLSEWTKEPIVENTQLNRPDELNLSIDDVLKYLVDHVTCSCLLCGYVFMCYPSEEMWYFHMDSCSMNL